MEVFSTREEAEEFLEDVRHDEPEVAEMLGIEAIEFGEQDSN
jgi:hypothetical protein